MTVTAQSIIDEARRLMADSNVSTQAWSDADLLKHLNRAQRFIVHAHPAANTVGVNIPLDAGFKQALPAAALKLVDITHNTGADGTEPGKPIGNTVAERLDIIEPEWRSLPQSDDVEMFVYNPINPREFLVYPPVKAGQNINGIYSTNPTPIASVTDEITLHDSYEQVLVFAAASIALAERIDSKDSLTFSANYKSAALELLGADSQNHQINQAAR